MYITFGNITLSMLSKYMMKLPVDISRLMILNSNPTDEISRVFCGVNNGHMSLSNVT